MNASEVLKGFAMKQVYSYLDKDPEANLPNLLDMLEKYDKNGQAVTTQVEGIRAALSDPNNNWSKLVKSLWTDIDDEQRKKLVETVVINGTLIDDAFADEMLRVKNLVPAISIEGFEEATDFRRRRGHLSQGHRGHDAPEGAQAALWHFLLLHQQECRGHRQRGIFRFH